MFSQTQKSNWQNSNTPPPIDNFFQIFRSISKKNVYFTFYSTLFIFLKEFMFYEVLQMYIIISDRYFTVFVVILSNFIIFLLFYIINNVISKCFFVFNFETRYLSMFYSFINNYFSDLFTYSSNFYL